MVNSVRIKVEQGPTKLLQESKYLWDILDSRECSFDFGLRCGGGKLLPSLQPPKAVIHETLTKKTSDV